MRYSRFIRAVHALTALTIAARVFKL